jgi:hypothetical protein
MRVKKTTTFFTGKKNTPYISNKCREPIWYDCPKQSCEEQLSALTRDFSKERISSKV